MNSKDAEASASAGGLSMEQDGFLLNEVTAPRTAGEKGMLSFTISSAGGIPVTDFNTSHDKKLHLIVVRTDGTEFRHVHPTMDENGVWSLPWEWTAAGTYRVYTDVVPATAGKNITLSRTVQVAGSFAPLTPAPTSATADVAGFNLALSGTLSASQHSTLTVTVTRDGNPVTTLQPYLGSYGHLVALREGDLAYLHVHPEGAEPEPGAVSGPEMEFMTQAPTPGRYLLYLDFQVDGMVQTAEFVLNAAGIPGGAARGVQRADPAGD